MKLGIHFFDCCIIFPWSFLFWMRRRNCEMILRLLLASYNQQLSYELGKIFWFSVSRLLWKRFINLYLNSFNVVWCTLCWVWGFNRQLQVAYVGSSILAAAAFLRFLMNSNAKLSFSLKGVYWRPLCCRSVSSRHSLTRILAWTIVLFNLSAEDLDPEYVGLK